MCFSKKYSSPRQPCIECKKIENATTEKAMLCKREKKLRNPKNNPRGLRFANPPEPGTI